MGRYYSLKVKKKVYLLRRGGLSLGEISGKTNIPKNTLSGWVKDIQLTYKQKERIRQKIIVSGAIGRSTAAEVLRKKMETWKQGIRDKVSYFSRPSIQNVEIGKLICGILYLCEGAKYPSTRCLVFGNSDPLIIRCFLGLLRKSFKINEEKLRCRVMYRWDQNINELNRYWSEITRIPLHHFFRTSPDKRTRGKPTLKEGYRGVCSVQYPSTALQFELQSIGETIIKGRI